jgi:hypothetical protein
MSRQPIVVRRRNKTNRKRKARRQNRKLSLVGIYNPETGQIGRLPAEQVNPGLSKTMEKRLARDERFTQERAERKLSILDKRWGVGLGPIRKRLQWMKDLLGG